MGRAEGDREIPGLELIRRVVDQEDIVLEEAVEGEAVLELVFVKWECASKYF